MKKINFKNKKYQNLPISINDISLTHSNDSTLDNKLFIDFFYPIGTYYTTGHSSFNPNAAWGGTWELEIVGQVHVSASKTGSYRVSGALTNTSDGGYTDQVLVAHTHSVPASGDHNHLVGNKLVDNLGKGSRDSIMEWTFSTSYFWSSTDGAHTHTFGNPTTGWIDNEPNSNYPSYEGIKRWHRIA